jgi:hypothetical protein
LRKRRDGSVAGSALERQRASDMRRLIGPESDLGWRRTRCLSLHRRAHPTRT